MWIQSLLLLCLSSCVDFGCSLRLCDRRVVVILDASENWDGFSPRMFTNQNNLIKKLVSSPNFSSFDRLALGFNFYPTTSLLDFGELHDQTEVGDYVDSLRQDESNAVCLPCALQDVYDWIYSSTFDAEITAVFFVSLIYESWVEDSRKCAKLLQEQGVRVVLIGHSKTTNDLYYNETRLPKITNDPNSVFIWNSSESLPASDYQDWFERVVGCQEAKTTTSKPTSQPTTPQSSAFRPCNKRIVFGLDDSEINKYYKNMTQFLYNIVLTADQWNHIERLGIAWYSDKINYKIPFDSSYNLEDIRTAIKRKPSVNGTVDLPAVLQQLSTQFPPNSEFTSVYYIVFVAHPLTQQIVDAALPYVQRLRQNGRLSLIGLGKEVDENLLFQLSVHETSWSDPYRDYELPGWIKFFTEDAYGCSIDSEI